MSSRISKRTKEERGAALVEFAFILPLLLVLLFGIVEMGLALRDQLTMSNAVTSSARIGSVLGDDAEADIAILDAVQAGLVGAVDSDVITKVIIYRADAAGNSTGDENHYTYDETDLTCSWYPCPDPAVGGFQYGDPGNWPPDTRVVTLPSPDILGVKIEFTHKWITTFIPFMSSPAHWTSEARVRLEPDVSGT